MERACSIERAARVRAAATSIGRPSLADPAKLEYAARLRDSGRTIPDIVIKTGLTKVQPLPPSAPAH